MRMQSFGGVLVGGWFGELCGGFVGERQRCGVTSIKLHSGFVEVPLRLGVLLWICCLFFGAPFNESTSGGLLLHMEYSLYT